MSETKPKLSDEKRRQIEKLVVSAIAGLIGLVVMWLLFAPSSGDEELATGFNTNMPEAVQDELIEDKQAGYKRELLSERDAEREVIKTLAEQLIKEDEAKVDVIPPSSGGGSTRPNYHKKVEPKDQIVASTNAYRDMNASLGNFYRDATPAVDTEKEEMQEELDELKQQLAMQQQVPQQMGVDEQLALMEKSYELAAKYMPSGEASEPTPSVTTPQIEEAKKYINGKVQVTTISQPRKQVVSTLSEPTLWSESNRVYSNCRATRRKTEGQPMSNEEFISVFSKSRNWGFNTAVGKGQESERNTINICVHSDQTIVDGSAVKMRLLEDMVVGDYTLPKSAIITGSGKIQGERLFIKITTLEHQGLIIPVELAVVDSDGQEGIYIPNSMEMNAIKEVAANLGSNMGTTINLNQQDAANQILTDLGKGAIQGVSQYVGKKMREVKVHLKAGYKLMLYQEKK